MFRFTFNVNYTTKDGKNDTFDSQITMPGDNVFTARAELTYRLSRNPHVFAPFNFELEKIESWEGGAWREVYALEN